MDSLKWAYSIHMAMLQNPKPPISKEDLPHGFNAIFPLARPICFPDLMLWLLPNKRNASRNDQKLCESQRTARPWSAPLDQHLRSKLEDSHVAVRGRRPARRQSQSPMPSRVKHSVKHGGRGMTVGKHFQRNVDGRSLDYIVGCP